MFTPGVVCESIKAELKLADPHKNIPEENKHTIKSQNQYEKINSLPILSNQSKPKPITKSKFKNVINEISLENYNVNNEDTCERIIEKYTRMGIVKDFN